MDKVEFVAGNRENIKFDFKKNDVEIITYIPQAVKLTLAKDYINLMFSSDDMADNYYSAEWGLIIGILDECSNVKVTDENFDSIISSGLWAAIVDRIENYEELRNDLKEIFKNESEERALEKSFGQALDKITNGVLEFIDKIKNSDLSEDGISNLVNKLNSVVEQTEQKFPGSTNKTRKPRKKKETKKIE